MKDVYNLGVKGDEMLADGAPSRAVQFFETGYEVIRLIHASSRPQVNVPSSIIKDSQSQRLQYSMVSLWVEVQGSRSPVHTG